MRSPCTRCSLTCATWRTAACRRPWMHWPRCALCTTNCARSCCTKRPAATWPPTSSRWSLPPPLRTSSHLWQGPRRPSLARSSVYPPTALPPCVALESWPFAPHQSRALFAVLRPRVVGATVIRHCRFSRPLPTRKPHTCLTTRRQASLRPALHFLLSLLAHCAHPGNHSSQQK